MPMETRIEKLYDHIIENPYVSSNQLQARLGYIKTLDFINDMTSLIQALSKEGQGMHVIHGPGIVFYSVTDEETKREELSKITNSEIIRACMRKENNVSQETLNTLYNIAKKPKELDYYTYAQACEKINMPYSTFCAYTRDFKDFLNGSLTAKVVNGVKKKFIDSKGLKELQKLKNGINERRYIKLREDIKKERNISASGEHVNIVADIKKETADIKEKSPQIGYKNISCEDLLERKCQIEKTIERLKKEHEAIEYVLNNF